MSRVIPVALGESRVVRAQAPEERGAEMLFLSAREAELAERFERQSRRLAIDIAASILNVAASSDGTLVSQSAQRALDRLPREHAATLRVHPLDREAAEAFASARAAPLHIAIDSNIERGGCVVEGAVGRVDARLETQLAAFARALGVLPARGDR